MIIGKELAAKLVGYVRELDRTDAKREMMGMMIVGFIMNKLKRARANDIHFDQGNLKLIEYCLTEVHKQKTKELEDIIQTIIEIRTIELSKLNNL